MALVNGMILDQPTIANHLSESPPWTSYSIEDARLITPRQTDAMLVYGDTARRDGEVEPFTALMASHYSLISGKPKPMLYQQTTITH